MNGKYYVAVHPPKDDDYTYEELQKLYTKQELADRLEDLYYTKHTIEASMKTRAITHYETRKFNQALDEIQYILSELLRDFPEGE